MRRIGGITSPLASNSGSQKNGTAPERNVTSWALIWLIVPPPSVSTSVMVARSAPIERCGSKNSLIEMRTSSPSNCRCEYWRSSLARALSGTPRRSLVRSTPSTMLARLVAKS
jgi:hypothetical protein